MFETLGTLNLFVNIGVVVQGLPGVFFMYSLRRMRDDEMMCPA